MREKLNIYHSEIFLMESMLRETMSTALNLKVPLLVDISYADNWGDLK